MTSYTPEFEAKVQAWAESRIKPKRLTHVRGVVEACDHLAHLYAPDDVMRARLAGWIHDSAKHLPEDEFITIAEAHHWPITDVERQVPDLLHGAVGYLLMADTFGIHDPALQSACTNHTTGDPAMNTLDKVVFLGDLIEPSRDFDGVEPLRQLAERDLDAAILMAVDATIIHLIKRNRILDPRPVFLRNKLLVSGVNYDPAK